MRLFGFDITRTKAAPASLRTVDSQAQWWPLLRESYAGAWQQNVEVSLDTVLTYSAVYACISLIASDVAKMPLRLVRKDADGIWIEGDNAAFSPVIRRPNHFQTPTQFVEWWLASKLIHGNTYVLKQRDNRGIVTALYVIHPLCVRPLIAPDGSVFYEVKADALAGIEDVVIVPARELIHDVMVPLYHPLVGVSPITACGLAATQGLRIQDNSAQFFANGSKPGGVLSAPGVISQETADRLKAYWDTAFAGDNMGKVAVLGDGLKYEPMAVNATDAQLIEQLKWTAENVATAYHVPYYFVTGVQPTYANAEPLLQQYYSQCLQVHSKKIEDALDFGLGLAPNKIDGVQWGTEFDLDYLILMDTAAKVSAAQAGIGSGAMAPNEARKRYFDLGKVEGGDSPMMQQQVFSLAALAERDEAQPFVKPPEAAPALPAVADEADEADDEDDDEDVGQRAVEEWEQKEATLWPLN